MKLFKQTLNYVAMIALSWVLFYLAQDVAEEVKSYEEPDYSDVAGCPFIHTIDYYRHCS